MAMRTLPAERLKAIGERVRAIREARGMGQREFAREKLGMTPANFSRMSDIERGVGSMTLVTIYELVEGLECTFDDLLGSNTEAKASADWQDGYRAGVADSIAQLRNLMENSSQ